jgi:hypothetical protein
LPDSDAVLGQLRERLLVGRKPAVKPPFEPPRMADLAERTQVLAFDPSLSNTGWVALCRVSHEIRIEGRGTLRPETGRDGYMGTWEKFRQLADELRSDMQLSSVLIWSARSIVWEAPPVGPASRPESSLLAGAALWQFYSPRREREELVVMSAQHASSVIIGNPRHDKGEIKAAVARYVPESEGRSWNEHQRDALLLGLAQLAKVAGPRG